MISLKSPFVILTILFLGSCASSSGKAVSGPLGSFSCNNEFDNPEANNIDELIELSSSIALYRVNPFNENKNTKPVKPKNETSSFFDYQSLSNSLSSEYYIYRLSREKLLRGEAQKKISLYGKSMPSEADYPPLESILQRHSELVSEDDLYIGLANRDHDLDGNCIYAGHFVPGYTYLIIDGVDSNAIYEPILDPDKDLFYLEVIKRIKALKEKGTD